MICAKMKHFHKFNYKNNYFEIWVNPDYNIIQIFVNDFHLIEIQKHNKNISINLKHRINNATIEWNSYDSCHEIELRENILSIRFTLGKLCLNLYYCVDSGTLCLNNNCLTLYTLKGEQETFYEEL